MKVGGIMGIASGQQGVTGANTELAAIQAASQQAVQASVQEAQQNVQIQGDSIAGRTIQAGSNIAEALGKGVESQDAQA